MAVQFDYICGVSQDFASLADLDSGRMQAEYAMRLRLPASAGNSVRYSAVSHCTSFCRPLPRFCMKKTAYILPFPFWKSMTGHMQPNI